MAGGHNFCWKAKIPGNMLSDEDYPVLTPYNKSESKTNPAIEDNTDTDSRCCYNSENVAIEHRNRYCENIIWKKNPLNFGVG